MSALPIAVLTGEGGGSVRLAAAALRHPDLAARSVRADELRLDGVAGVVIDAPCSLRAEVLAAVLPRCRAPILVEFPAAPTSRALPHARERVLSLNPLRHALPTRRLRDTMLGTRDPLETFFAAWRFRAGETRGDALAQLLDYVAALGPGRPVRASASTRRNPDLLLALLRYESGVLGSLEVGGHLPATARVGQELVLECFCRESVYHCWPGNQAVSVEGRESAARDWSPDPAEHMLSVFADTILGRQVAEGYRTDDAITLELAEALLAGEGRVRGDHRSTPPCTPPGPAPP